MKLKLPAKYGQRETTWSSTLLGYNASTYTIGSHGCLITDLGNYLGLTPLQVNKILCDGGGYTSGSGNFIWSKCSLLGLTQVYSSPYYSDPVTSQGITKMKALLDEGRPLLTHVDFDPSDPDDDQHWILIYGYEGEETFFAFDPWSKSDITLDVYGGVKRAVYEFKAYDKKLIINGVDDALSSCMSDREHFWKLSDEWKLKYEEEVKQYNELTSQHTLLLGEKENLAKQLAESLSNYADLTDSTKQQIDGQIQQIEDLTANLAKITKERDELKVALAGSASDKQQRINELETQIAGLNKKIEELILEKQKQPKFEIAKIVNFELKSERLKVALIKFERL